MYERMLESIVCILIPFYDEFKALALLFLILTRARVCLSPCVILSSSFNCFRELNLYIYI
jgi:hypothetical protein